jgi:thiol-disulfide isomerase/thioredoxin
MSTYAYFEKALPYDAFLTQYGSAADRSRWDRVRAQIVLSDEQTKLLQSFKRQQNVLFLAGAWCGDCVSQCPILEAFAAVNPLLQVRYLDRDAFPEAQAALQINGGNRVPVALFFSEDGFEVARFGERTLAAYRRAMAQLGGEFCGSGVQGRDELEEVIADWLREVERVQYILRLSGRLRRLHAD